MATYATDAQLQTYFGSEQYLIAADRDGDGSPDTGVVADVIAKASEEIDSYLCVRYTLPLATVPGILLGICCDIWMYRISINSPAMTDEKRRRYEDAIGWLKSVAKGIAGIGVLEEGADVEDNAIVSSDSEIRLFSRTKLAGVL